MRIRVTIAPGLDDDHVDTKSWKGINAVCCRSAHDLTGEGVGGGEYGRFSLPLRYRELVFHHRDVGLLIRGGADHDIARLLSQSAPFPTSSRVPAH